MKPIRIAGGGLAGLSVAIGLRREGVPVQLFESSTFPRHRVCGEFISGVSDETLRSLGIEDCLRDAESLSSTAWYDRGGRIFSAVLPSPAMGVSRYRLDERLSLLLRELGGEFIEGERFPSTESKSEGVVIATGRAIEKGSGWLGLKAHLIDFELQSDLEMHLGEEGYIGLSRVEEGRVNAAGLFRRRPEVKSKGADALVAYTKACGLEQLAGKMQRGSFDPESAVGVSSFGFGLKGKTTNDGFRIGDQRAIIPPFTGNGMSMAIQSAEIAVPFLSAYARGERQWNDCLSDYAQDSRKYFSRRLTAARCIHPLIFSRFGQMITRQWGRSGLLPFSLLYRAVR